MSDTRSHDTHRRQRVLNRVKEITNEILGIPVEELKRNDHFIDDLGADSLAMLELRQAIEDRFDIVIRDQDVEFISSIEEVSRYLENRLREKS